MTNVVSLRNTGGFTRMDNDLYEALIGADLSGRELRVALAIHRFTAGYNCDVARIPAATIAGISGIARENVSRIISELIRQGVVRRAGGSKAPIGIAPAAEWKIDSKNQCKTESSKTTQSVKSDTSLVSLSTHIKDRKDITAPSELVAAAAATATEADFQAEQPQPVKAESVPFKRIAEIYNTVCAPVLPRCVELTEKRKSNIRKCWNMKIAGQHPFRSAEFWEGYFNDCMQNRHWTGNNDRNWRAHLEFLTREENVLRVLEGQA